MSTYEITLKTTTGYEDYTVTAHTPQAAEIQAVELYLLQNPTGTVRGAERNGSMTTKPYDAPADVEYPVSRPAGPEVAKIAPGCPALAEPGDIHLVTAHCVDCNAFRMAKMSADEVGNWYRSGHFNQDEYEAFMHVWATSTVRHTVSVWAEEPTFPKVITVVAALRRHAGIVVPAILAA